MKLKACSDGSEISIPKSKVKWGFYIALEDLTVFKRLRGGSAKYICKMTVPEGTKIFIGHAGYGPRKCRAAKAKVENIVNSNSGGKPSSVSHRVFGFHRRRGTTFKYKVGELVSARLSNKADNCQSGIHFFLTENEAMRFKL